MKYNHILNAVQNEVWAILPDKLHQIMSFLSFKAEGGEVSQEDIAAVKLDTYEPYAISAEGIEKFEAAVGAPGMMQSKTKPGSIVVLPLHGTIAHRAGMMSEMSGGVSCEKFTHWFRAAVADPNCKQIIIDVNSPGGSVCGVQELSDEIYNARSAKKITAVANSMAASAAYWIGSAASELVVIPSGSVGSIGVITAHEDLSKALESQGVKVTFITGGQYKAEGNSTEPLSDEAKAFIQSQVDTFYDKFVAAVARNRGRSVKDVMANFGQGRLILADEAKKRGMVDRIGTLDQMMQKMGIERPGMMAMAGMKAEGDMPMEPEQEPMEMPEPDPDKPTSECQCQCAPCQEGDCESCNHAECTCENCTCHDMQPEESPADANVEILRKRLSLL